MLQITSREAGRLLINYYREHTSCEEALTSQLDAMLGMQYGNVTVGATGEQTTLA